MVDANKDSWPAGVSPPSPARRFIRAAAAVIAAVVLIAGRARKCPDAGRGRVCLTAHELPPIPGATCTDRTAPPSIRLTCTCGRCPRSRPCHISRPCRASPGRRWSWCRYRRRTICRCRSRNPPCKHRYPWPRRSHCTFPPCKHRPCSRSRPSPPSWAYSSARTCTARSCTGVRRRRGRRYRCRSSAPGKRSS